MCREDVDGTGRCVADGPSEGEGEGEGGSCAPPFARALPLDVEPSTAGLGAVQELSCGEVPSLQEAVWLIEVPAGRDLHVEANDSSGQGVGVELRAGSCDGPVRGCTWASNGVVDERMITDTGPSVLVVERAPYTLSVSLFD